MSDINEYTGALKYAFSQVAGAPKDWTAGVWMENKEGQLSAYFENAKAGIMLYVVDEGYDAVAGGRKFSAESDTNKINTTIPDNWKGLDF